MYTRKRMRSAKVQEDAGILPSASYARESLSRSACAGCPVARARSPGRQQRRRGVRGQVFTNQPVGGREGGRRWRRGGFHVAAAHPNQSRQQQTDNDEAVQDVRDRAVHEIR